MRLKTFSAKTMGEVMDLVRAELGPDAIIVSIDQGKKVGGVRVTAAVDSTAPTVRQGPAPDMQSRPSPATAEEEETLIERASFISREYDKADLTAVLNHHGFPYELASRLNEGAGAMAAASLPEALGGALETVITCGAITAPAPRPVMFVGPPGAGKTVTAAKIAAETVLNNHSVRLISTDTVKSGGVQQLDHFASLMKLSVSTAASASELKSLIAADRTPRDITIIDTSGTNPFDMDDLEALAHLVKASGAEPVLVLPAGLDPLEAADVAEIFSQLGTRRFVATRLDTARRFASVVTAARGGRMTLSGISRTPYVAEGLETPTPFLFARILCALPDLRRSGRSASGQTNPSNERALS